MNRLGWLILFFGYQPPGELAPPPELDPLRVQKGLFLLDQVAVLPEDEAYDFKAHDYGPVSPQIYGDIDNLIAAHLLRQSKPGPNERYWYSQATDIGRTAANDLAQKADPRHLLYLEVIRSLLNELQFNEIVSGIYAAYPDYSVATTAPDLLPGSPGGAANELAKLFTPEEIRFRADTLLGMRQIEGGQYLTRDEMKSALKNGA